MRDAFVDALTDLAERDERVCLLTGDLGIGLFDRIAALGPGRFVNAGIAEQALVGVAAGLAYAGKRPVAYSIAPFLTSRAHDQVRVDVAMPRANVVLAGVGGGLGYGSLGPTHHGIEDIAAMRSLPGMTVLAPADPREAARATVAAVEHDGPVYLRLGKNGEPDVLPDDRTFLIGRARWLSTGTDVTLASTGTMLPETLDAAELLAAQGVRAGVAHFGTVKPLDTGAVETALRRTPLLVTVEEGSVAGGFGGAVAEAMAESGLPGRLVRVGLRDTFAHAVGSRAFLLRRYGLCAEAIAARALDALGLAGLERAA